MEKEVLAERTIFEAAERYNLPWVLGFSGGKDSTTALSLLVNAINEGANIKSLYVVYADTLLEQPVLHKETIDVLKSLKVVPSAVPIVLTPAEGEDYISMILEKGYPVASWYFRWCVDRLKIRPVKRFMKKLGHAVKVLAVRSDESASRRKTTMVNGERPAIIDGENPTVRPIITWTEADVVQYLKEHKRWDGRTFDYLIDLYGYQINDACTPNTFCLKGAKPPLTLAKVDKEIRDSEFPYSAYTSVRFGCWLCTVVQRNKMPVSPVLESAREKLRQISDDMANREFIDGKPRKLNEKGRAKVARVLLGALEKEPEAFGYNLDQLKGKLREWVAHA